MKLKNKIFTALMAAGITATAFIPSFADINKEQIDLDKPSTGVNMKAQINGKDAKLYVRIINGKAYIRERDFMAMLGFKEQLPDYNDAIGPSFAIYNPKKDYVFETRRLGTYDVGTKEQPNIKDKEPATWKYPRIKNYTSAPEKSNSKIEYKDDLIRLLDENGNRLDFLIDDTINSELFRKVTDLPTAAKGMVKYNKIPPVAVEVKYDNKTNKIIINTTMKLNKDMPAQKVGNTPITPIVNTANQPAVTPANKPAVKTNLYNNQTKEEFRNNMLKAINDERKKYGRDPLVLDDDLNKVAEERVRMEQIEKNPIGKAHVLNGERPSATGRRILNRDIVLGENMYMTSVLKDSSPEYMVRGWITSPGHHRNMINKRFTKIGIDVDTADVDGEGEQGYSKIYAGVCYTVFE